MQSTRGEIPIPIVQPESSVDGVLTTDPIVVQKTSDPHVMTRYLRQLNRRKGSRSAGHNDAVIWNISNRLPKLEVEQQIKVSIFYFEQEELDLGTYEIRSQGIFPRVFPNQRLTPQSSSTFASLLPLLHTPLKLSESKSPITEQVAATSTTGQSAQAESAQIPQKVSNTIANLVECVKQLQQELLTTQNTLQNHETSLGRMEERIRQLEVENCQLQEIRDAQDTILQSLLPRAQKSSPSQTLASFEETDEDVIPSEPPSLFEQIGKSQPRSAPLREPAANYLTKHRRKKS